MAEALTRCPTCKRLHKPHCGTDQRGASLDRPIARVAAQVVEVTAGKTAKSVANTDAVANAVVNKGGRGVYKDLDKRRAYMAVYMREYRKRHKL